MSDITSHQVSAYLTKLQKAYLWEIDLMPAGSVGAERLAEKRRVLVYAASEVNSDEAKRIIGLENLNG